MKLEEQLQKRSDNQCALCQSAAGIQLYEVLPQPSRSEDNCMMLCNVCQAQIDRKAELDNSHWSCLSQTTWSEVPGIQVISWRMLHRLKAESWAMDSLDMMYLTDETLAWAKATGDHENDAAVAAVLAGARHVCRNGVFQVQLHVSETLAR